MRGGAWRVILGVMPQAGHRANCSGYVSVKNNQ